MSEQLSKQLFQEWLKIRPESVQKLVAEFPPNSAFDVDGETLYLLGYTENDALIVSAINPWEDYDETNANQKYICASHFREAEKHEN